MKTRTMTRYTPFLALLAGILPLSAVCAQDDASSPADEDKDVAYRTLAITSVVVYEDRALVTREGLVPLLGGGTVETVRVGGYRRRTSETSLRAGVEEKAEGRVISVASDVRRRRQIQDTRLRSAEEARRQVALKITEIDDALSRIATREKYLKAYEKIVHKAVSERTGGGEPQDLKRWTEALDFIRKQRESALGRRRDANKERGVLAEEHKVLAAEVDRLRRPEERSERTAEVTVESSKAGDAKLRLSYVIEGARWSPRYDARFDVKTLELEVTYFGEVRQQTGEDWKDVQLILSTARPSVGASRPELLPVRLAAVARAPAAKGRIAHTRRAAEGEADDAVRLELAGAVALEPVELEDLVTTESRENATSATFTVPGTATIPADERPHKVPVIQFRERGKTAFETVPRLQRFVYLKCSARNGSPYPMLAGAVDIYRGSGFIGTSQLEFVAPNNPFEVSLGIEESLKVRRVVTDNAWDDDKKIERHGYDIEVANFANSMQATTVIENYPVSDIEEVEVEVDSSTTRANVHTPKTGMMKWVLNIPPGETRTVHLEYSIRYPRNYRR